ncbi:MAG: type II secretion system F family protein [Planctomycetota bacterium]|jgi:general secretion pathway protein F
MMVVVAVAVVVFLMSVVIPSITAIFIEMNRSLPWPTRFLIATSAFMKTYLKFIVPVLIVVLLGLRAACRTKEGREFADRWKLKLPLFGKLFLKAEIARLARTLGILLISGIPILSALEIAKQVIQNRVIAGAMDSVKDIADMYDDEVELTTKTLTSLLEPVILLFMGAVVAFIVLAVLLPIFDINQVL